MLSRCACDIHDSREICKAKTMRKQHQSARSNFKRTTANDNHTRVSPYTYMNVVARDTSKKDSEEPGGLGGLERRASDDARDRPGFVYLSRECARQKVSYMENCNGSITCA